MKYQEIKEQHPECINVFFAFSNSQFEEAIKKQHLENEKIFSASAGLYGTKEGIKKFFAFYDELAKQISNECDPQEVYNYEFGNHECDYVGNDTEAYNITLHYFGEERSKGVKRLCKASAL
jgi:hypothetical protein